MAKAVRVGFIATSGFVPMYGRAVLSQEDVRTIYERIKAGGVPMTPHHDERNAAVARYRTLELRPTPTGELGVWAEVEFEDEIEAAKYGGWSIGWFADTDPGDERDPRPPMRFGADVFHFSDDEREASAASLRNLFQVLGGRYYQLGLEPPASVVLVFVVETLRAIPADILASVLYDALKRMLPAGRRTRNTLYKFSMRKGADGEIDVRGILETDSPEALREVTKMVTELGQQAHGIYVPDLETGRWKRLDPPKPRGNE